MRMARIILTLLTSLLVGACGLQKQADSKFGDQHFKTSIALVELHKIRTGSYPQSLKDLQFAGDWDAIALVSVEYRRLEAGYELNLTRGWMGKPDLSYPKEFWQGLGLVKSNIRSGQ